LEFSFFEKIFIEFSSRYKSSINDLSRGERRLLELYIIVKSKSYFALLDEPFSYLSPIQIDKAKEFLLEETKNKGLLVTDHLFRHVTDICYSLYILSNGKTHLAKDINDIERLGYANFNS